MKNILDKLSQIEASAPELQKKKVLKESAAPVQTKPTTLKDLFYQLDEGIAPGQKPLPVMDPTNKKTGMGFVTSNNPGVQNVLKNLDPKDVQIVQAPGTQPTQPTQPTQQQQAQPAAAGATGQAPAGQTQMKEKFAGNVKLNPAKKGMFNGKTKAELEKQLSALHKSGPHKKGSPEYTKQQELNFAIRAKSGWKKSVDEADIAPTSGIDTDGAGLGAGRSNTTLEGKKAKPDFLDLDKDGNKKESMKKAASDKQKKAVKENMNNRIQAARLEGKAHGLKGHPHCGKNYDDMEECRAYHEGYKEGLDECHGMGPIAGLRTPHMPATVHGMADQALDEGRGSYNAVMDAIRHRILRSHVDLVGKFGPDKIMAAIEDQARFYDSIDLDEIGSSDVSIWVRNVIQDLESGHYDYLDDEDSLPLMNRNKLNSMANPAFKDDMEEGNAFTGALAKTHKGGKFKVGGKTFTDHSGYDSKLSEEQLDELSPELLRRAGDAAQSKADNRRRAVYDRDRYAQMGRALPADPVAKFWDKKMEKFNGGAEAAQTRDQKAAAYERETQGMSPAQKRQYDKMMKSDELIDPNSAGTAQGGATVPTGKAPTPGVKTESDFAFEAWDRQLENLINEGLSVSISKDNPNTPDSVNVNATDQEADKLLSLVRQAGMGIFGGEDEAGMSHAPVIGGASEINAPGEIEVVDDHDGMMSLIKKMSDIGGGGNHQEDYDDGDYADEEGHDSMDYGHDDHEETCNECGMMESQCGCNEEVLDEVESEDQMEYEVAEDQAQAPQGAQNPPDNGSANSSNDTAGNNAANSALATADQTDQPEMAESKECTECHCDPCECDDEEDPRFPHRHPDDPRGDDRSFRGDDHYRVRMREEEDLTEWANDAGPGKTVSDTTFEQDIDFMTKVISGGLNKKKSTGQTTVPVVATQLNRLHSHDTTDINESLLDWKKLAGL